MFNCRLEIVFSFIFVLLFAAADEQNVRILIHYRDDQFISEALAAAVTPRLDANITARRILAITVRDNSVVERLRENEFVEYVEPDQVMSTLVRGGFSIRDFRPDVDGKPLGDGEFKPYGINMVQADQFEGIPEVQEDLQVCVVE
jgi:hypothetical protein